MENCSKCNKTFTLYQRKEISCPKCDYSECLICFKETVLDTNKCKCGHEYTKEDHIKFLPKTWIENKLGDECVVCFEKISRTKNVICINKKCTENTCLDCFKRWILTKGSEPSCYHCKIVFDETFLRQRLPNTWLNNEYKEIHLKILNEREQSELVRVTQNITNDKKINKYLREMNPILSYKSESHKKYKEILNLKVEILQKYGLTKIENVGIKSFDRGEEIFEHLDNPTDPKWSNGDYFFLYYTSDNPLGKCYKFYISLDSIKQFKEQNDHDVEISLFYNMLVKMRKITSVKREEIVKIYQSYDFQNLNTKSEFIKQCIDPGCNGYLTPKWECMICDKIFCEKCHEKMLEEHECDKKTIATIKLLQRDTKPCPNNSCKAPIHKIDGCDQMWCALCQTVFNWITLEIQTKGAVHNPEFFAFQRRLAEQTGNNMPREFNACADRLREEIEKFRVTEKHERMSRHLTKCIREQGSNQGWFQRRTRENESDMEYSREKRVKNELCEDSWNEKVWAYYRKKDCYAGSLEISTFSLDTLNHWHAMSLNGHTITNDQIDELFIMTKKSISSVSGNYKIHCKTPVSRTF